MCNYLDGNILLILTRNEIPTKENELCNEDIDILATDGGQPSLYKYANEGKVLVWDTKPNLAQMRRIAEIMMNSYFKQDESSPKMQKNAEKLSSPLTKSARKAKIDKVFAYYNKPEKPWEVQEWAQSWKRKQTLGFLNCLVL